MRLINFRQLASKGPLATTIIRLMMACNDLGLADHSLAQWHQPAETRQRRRVGAKMYFLRLEIAHMYEALSIIQEIQANPALRQAVAVSDWRTKKSFNQIRRFIGSNDWKRMLRIRNNITFHYGDKATEKAFARSAAGHPDRYWQISGEEPIDWFFEPADRIIDRIVVTDIFGILDTADIRKEVDTIVVRLHEAIKVFADFAGYFIWHHTGR
jgi:hypothetical protein